MSIIDTYILSIPAFFERLLELESISQEDITAAGDGFFAVTKSISTILHSKGIDTFPDNQDQLLDCHNYFDDWYLYAVPSMNGHVYSLFKMREQEHDADMGLAADGDTPGVTISFIAFNTDILKQCLFTPDYANRKALGIEINRVVSYRKQLHNPYLKCYFIRPEAVGTYMIADLYTHKTASFASDGMIKVPEAYSRQYRKRRKSLKFARLQDFLDLNNAAAGHCICDHDFIYIQDPEHLTIHEKLAVLATHTANTSFHSFAAEVRYHAKFLVWYAKAALPFAGGSPYASAVRADMTIDDKEFEGPTLYYNEKSSLFQTQVKHHKDWC